MATKPFLLLALCVSLVGCEFGPDQQMVGAWSANRRLSKLPDLASFDPSGRITTAFYATQIKLSSDHTFVLTGLRQMGGTWNYAKGVLNLIPSKETKPTKWQLSSQIRTFNVNEDFTRMIITIPLPIGSIELVLDKTA